MSPATDNRRVVSDSIVIAAEPAEIFAVLADPKRHKDFDGSGTVTNAKLDAPDRLSLGAKFGMRMRQGVPYAITNTVVAFEEDRLITWRHLGGHRWSYRLEPTADGTRVTESFDWSTSLIPLGLELVGYPARNGRNIAATLNRLQAIFT